jgi:hypothetical protein
LRAQLSEMPHDFGTCFARGDLEKMQRLLRHTPDRPALLIAVNNEVCLQQSSNRRALIKIEDGQPADAGEEIATDAVSQGFHHAPSSSVRLP